MPRHEPGNLTAGSTTGCGTLAAASEAGIESGAAVSSPSPAPVFTRVEMTGPSSEVGRLMEALSGSAEIRFDSRSDPDARGEVTCIAEVATVPGQQMPAAASASVTVTVQAVLEVDLSRWPDRSLDETSRQIADGAASLLRATPGSGDVQARVVSVRAARAPQS